MLGDVTTCQAAERVRLTDEVSRAQRADVEVPPPGRFGLPPVPVEQIGQQRLRPLHPGPRGRIRWNVGQQRGLDPGDVGILGGVWLLCHSGPGQVFTQPPGQLCAALFQPVAERQGGPAVVLVVPGDDPPLLIGVLCCGIFERGLECDQVARCLRQIYLPRISAQRLQPLDGIALHTSLDPLPDDAVEVHEYAEPEQVVYLVLTGGEPAHQPAYRFLAGLVQFREMVN